MAESASLDKLTATGIPYELISPGPSHDILRDAWSATEVYRMYWDANLDLFIEESFPSPVWISLTLLYPLPRTMPGFPWLYTKSVKIEPFIDDKPGGPSALGAAYIHTARVTIQYETLDREEETVDSKTFLSHKISIGGEFLTLPASGFKWEGTTKIVQNEDIGGGKLIPTAEHQFTWDLVPNPPFAAIRAAVGGVNNATFFGAAAETLLFLGAEMERQFTTDGLSPWKLDYRFSERLLKFGSQSVGWNHFYRPNTGTWTRLIAVATSAYVYPLVPYSGLFQG